MNIHMKKNFLNSLLILTVLLLFNSCKNEEWDDHYLQSDQRLDTDIASLIMSDPELSTFAGLLTQTGYDVVLAQDQAFTVWAPVNDALTGLSSDVLNDPDKLKALVGNHISRFSYTSTKGAENDLVKMLNNKYIKYLNQSGSPTFADAVVINGDLLTNNGILHKINALVDVRENIWGALKSSNNYPEMMNYLSQFDFIMFDPINSVVTGQNSLGQAVYDSVFVGSNTYFDIVGNLNSEEERYTFVALTDDVYKSAYDSISPYFSHPDSMTVVNNTVETIFNNLNFSEFNVAGLNGATVTNTLGNEIALKASDVALENKLSNGSILELSNYGFAAKDLIYKPIRFEIETTARRTIGSVTDLTIQKKYNVAASGEFANVVQLLENPDGTNDYFTIAFSNVLSAKYNLFVKYAPVGATQQSKVRYEVSVMGANADGSIDSVGYSIPDTIIVPTEERLMQIGDTYDIPTFIDNNPTNPYSVLVKVFVSVSQAELVLYGRKFGIDYIELVPAE